MPDRGRQIAGVPRQDLAVLGFFLGLKTKGIEEQDEGGRQY
jgi:hypothetical protein